MSVIPPVLGLTNINNQVSSAVTTINSNMVLLAAACGDALSRTGAQPNQMESSLDMNNFKIINLPAATGAGQPVEYEQWATNLNTTVQTIITTTIRSVYLGAGTAAVANNTNAAATNTAAVISAVATLVALGGGTLYIDNVYYVNPIEVQNITTDLTVTFLPGAKLIGAAGFTQPVLWLDAAGSDGAQVHKLTINNPWVDCSAGNDSAGNQSSALHATYWQEFNVNQPHLYGGTTYTNTNADSGIESVDCAVFNCNGGFITGFSDAAIYLGGDNTLSDLQQGLVQNVTNTTITHCNTGVETKRAFHYTRVVGCTFSYCKVGCATVNVSGDQNLYPGRRLDVIGSRFEFITSQAITYNFGSWGKVIGNTIEDFGYTENGITAAGTTVAGIYCSGASGCTIENNDIRLVNWTNNNTQFGVISANITNNIPTASTTWYGGGHSVKGNTYTGLYCAGSDTSGSLPCVYEGESLNGTFTIANGPYHLVTNSRAEYSIPGSNTRKVQVGTTIYTVVHEQFHAKISGTIFSGIGVLTNGSQNTPLSVSVPGALNGDTVVVTPMNSAAVSLVQLTWMVRALTDNIQIIFLNNTGASRDFSTLQYSAEVWRRDNT